MKFDDNKSECLNIRKNDSMKNAETTNPYLVSKMQYNEWHYDLNRAKRNWEIFAVMLLVSLIFCVGAICMLANKSKFIPYVVHVDSLGDAQFVNLLKAEDDISMNEYKSFIYNYINNTFRVINDDEAQKHALDFVYATTSQQAISLLNQYFKENDPFQLARSLTVEIKINSILPRSDKSWQVKWTAIKRNHEGRIEAQESYEGLITIKRYKLNDYQQLLINPLGIFVEYITWSIQH